MVESIYAEPMQSEMMILGKDSAQNYWYTYVLIFLLYFMIIFYGQMIAVSVTTEKSNRAIEILVTSVNSNSLIFGKVLAGAISGVVQAGIILGSALFFLSGLCRRLGPWAGFSVPDSDSSVDYIPVLWSNGISAVCICLWHGGRAGIQDRGYQQKLRYDYDYLYGLLFHCHLRNDDAGFYAGARYVLYTIYVQ